MIFLHGILGRGVNWKTVAKSFVAARPNWSATLVDLRAHGQSQQQPGPDTVMACAEDLRALSLDVPVGAVLGHSFGGKVAIAFGATEGIPTWVIDSTPSARPNRRGSESVLEVLASLRTLEGQRFTHRRDFVAALSELGIARPVAMWLAMNLVSEGEALRFGLDLDRIDALLADYFVVDLWASMQAVEMHLVVGGKSNVVSEEDVERAASLAVPVHRIEEAGHWVHVDAPDALVALLAENVPS